VYPIAGLDILEARKYVASARIGTQGHPVHKLITISTVLLNCAQFVIINNIYAIVNRVPSKQSTRISGNDTIMNFHSVLEKLHEDHFIKTVIPTVCVIKFCLLF